MAEQTTPPGTSKVVRMLKIDECTINELFNAPCCPWRIIKEKLTELSELIVDLPVIFRGEPLFDEWNMKLARMFVQYAELMDKARQNESTQVSGSNCDSFDSELGEQQNKAAIYVEIGKPSDIKHRIGQEIPAKITKFANLPDDCYYLIFARLPTTTLLSCRRVSRTWQRHQQIACRNRRSLILLQGTKPAKLLTNSQFQAAFISHGIDQAGQPMNFNAFLLHNQVKLFTFNQNVTRFLTKTFPKLSKLFVVQRDLYSQDVIEPLINLLQLYFSRVVTIKMYFDYRGEPVKVMYSNILKVIRQLNSMPTLEHITLESLHPPGLGLKLNHKDLEFLTRIKEFYFYSPKISNDWHKALNYLEQTGNLSQIKQIGLGTNILAANGPTDRWHLANRFTHFPFCSRDYPLLNDLLRFDKCIALFSSLSSFTIDCTDSAQLTNKLNILSRHCPSLVHVKLIAKVLFVQPFDPSTVKPLESVKALDLEIPLDLNSDLKALADPLVHVFPSLASIKLISRRDRHLLFFFYLTFLSLL